MILKLKERKEINFQEVEIGQIFKYEDSIFMKVDFKNDYICCPRCGEDIHINEEKGMSYAVELNSGLIYDFGTYSIVEIVQGAFVEE